MEKERVIYENPFRAKKALAFMLAIILTATVTFATKGCERTPEGQFGTEQID